MLLSLCVHAFYHFDGSSETDDARIDGRLLEEWNTVCRRVGKKPPKENNCPDGMCVEDGKDFNTRKSRGSYLGWVDLFLHNWHFSAGASPQGSIAHVKDAHKELDVALPMFASQSEHSFIIGTVEMEIRAIPLLESICMVQECMIAGNDSGIMVSSLSQCASVAFKGHTSVALLPYTSEL